METIGRYSIRAELGRGGMGVVYRAYDPELDRNVAIKSVLIEGLDDAERQRNEAALAREAKAAARLQHPHTVSVYDFFTVGKRAYIVMEFVAGATLQSKLNAGKPLPLEECTRLLAQAASALDAAHAAGIVHRDVKPANLLIDAHGNAKIADFGIARLNSVATQTQGSMGMSPGTLGYMSPEQVRGEKLDGRSDQFALGVVAYQALTGKLPFAADNWIGLSYQILNQIPPAPSSLLPALPRHVDAAIARAMAKRADDRFSTCAAAIDAMQIAALPAPSRAPLWAARAIATLLAIGAAIWFWPGAKPSPIVAPTQTAAEKTVPNSLTPPPAATPSLPPTTTSAALTLDSETLAFVPIPAGRFVMGCGTCTADQGPEHAVEITRPFEIARTEISERLYNAVLSGKATGGPEPAVNVSWLDSQRFIAKLNAKPGTWRYRLPTEAEWEYAARAGDTKLYPRDIAATAWTDGNTTGALQPVGTSRLPNAWGVYDMLGNASEWVADYLDPAYYASSPARDPQGPDTGAMRIFRGGGVRTSEANASYAVRFADEPTAKGPALGFRIVRVKLP